MAVESITRSGRRYHRHSVIVKFTPFSKMPIGSVNVKNTHNTHTHIRPSYLRVLAVADDGLHLRRALGEFSVGLARQLLVRCLPAVVQDHLRVTGGGGRG